MEWLLMPASPMTVLRQDDLDVVEFAPDAELDSFTMNQIQSDLYALVEDRPGRGVVLDFSNVSFASSQALGCLVTLRLKAARSRAKVVLAAVPEPLMDIVRLTQLDRLYEIFDTREEAIAALSAA
jgi:anti-sigma B factor antagonist